MKKRLAATVMAAMVVGVLGGCGKADANMSLETMDVDKYVTLGEYKSLNVSVEDTTVTDAQVEESALNAYKQHVTAENGGIMDRAVEKGDIVNIDYEGKKDGVAFAGGTAQSQLLTIGSGQFIPGFEEGLEGVMPGETVDIDLTFPEVYQSPDLAGQDVVFTVTVNCIAPDKMEDAVVANFGLEGVKTVDDYRQAARESLTEQAQRYYNQSVQNGVLNAFMNVCEFKDIPQEMADKYAEVVRTQVMQQAAGYGMEAEAYAQAAYQMDLETLVKEYSMAGVKQDIALQAVANRENLNIDKEELDTILKETATAAGYDTVEEFMGESTPEDYRDYFVTDKALNFLIENAVVSVAVGQ